MINKEILEKANVIINNEPITSNWLKETGWLETDDAHYFVRHNLPYPIDDLYLDTDDNVAVIKMRNEGVCLLEFTTKGQLIAFMYSVTGELIEQPTEKSWDRYKKYE